MFNDLGGSVFGVGWSKAIKGPTTELFMTLGDGPRNYTGWRGSA